MDSDPSILILPLKTAQSGGCHQFRSSGRPRAILCGCVIPDRVRAWKTYVDGSRVRARSDEGCRGEIPRTPSPGSPSTPRAADVPTRDGREVGLSQSCRARTSYSCAAGICSACSRAKNNRRRTQRPLAPAKRSPASRPPANVYDSRVGPRPKATGQAATPWCGFPSTAPPPLSWIGPLSKRGPCPACNQINASNTV